MSETVKIRCFQQDESDAFVAFADGQAIAIREVAQTRLATPIQLDSAQLTEIGRIAYDVIAALGTIHGAISFCEWLAARIRKRRGQTSQPQQTRPLFLVEHDGQWHAIRTLEDVQNFERLLRERAAH